MSTIVEHSVEIDAPVPQVFDYVDDFGNTRDWLYGLERIEPVTEQLRGVGATYEGTMKVGVRLTSRLRCTAWEKDSFIEISSLDGIRNTQRWRFTRLDGDRTRVDAWISFDLPGGAAGRAAGAAVRPLIGVAVKHTSQRLVENLEARSA
ncbi:SRPBCC family protein [Nocardioides sambongensis]|uniref:SRPBCC family protein n=1 Tax=Nocardioides sambongensis TaxID=2589074 RepID=UPI001126CC5B|nr:SRPBCC family protein [Nocardioides sambongensis]